MIPNTQKAVRYTLVLLYLLLMGISFAATAMATKSTHIDLKKLDVVLDNPPNLPFKRSDINLLNWQHWPYSRYASHHPREFVTMATIYADREASALVEKSNDELGLSSHKVLLGQGEVVTLEEALNEIHMKGFAIMHGGKLAFETYGQGMQKHDIQVLQSSSKTFIGMLVYKLAHEGLLDLTANVKDYLPDLNAAVYDGATLQHMLDMQVGFPKLGDYHKAGELGYLSEIHLGLKPKVLGIKKRSTLSFIRQFQKPTFVPGSEFTYADMNTQVLMMIAERITGKSYAQLIEETFWLPLQARYDAAIAVDDEGHAGASWGLAVSLRDAARFGQMMLERGTFNGQRIIPESYFKDTYDTPFSGHSTSYEILGMAEQYKNHVWMMQDANLMYTAGSFGQYIFVDYKHKFAVVFMANWANNSIQKNLDDMLRIVLSIGERIAKIENQK